MMPFGSCGSSYPVAEPVEPCRVSAFPAPLEMTPEGCGERVCYSIEDTIAWLKWEQAVDEFWRDVTRCPYVDVSK